jgi:hypothetical protein
LPREKVTLHSWTSMSPCAYLDKCRENINHQARTPPKATSVCMSCPKRSSRRADYGPKQIWRTCSANSKRARGATNRMFHHRRNSHHLLREGDILERREARTGILIALTPSVHMERITATSEATEDLLISTIIRRSDPQIRLCSNKETAINSKAVLHLTIAGANRDPGDLREDQIERFTVPRPGPFTGQAILRPRILLSVRSTDLGGDRHIDPVTQHLDTIKPLVSLIAMVVIWQGV